MGTRHIIIVHSDNSNRVAQFGQWDGYPEGQGLTVLRFLRDMNRSQFETNVRQVKSLTADEVGLKWVDAGADPDSNFVNMEISKRFERMYPQLHRDCGAKVLQLIHDQPAGLELFLQIDFVGDGLFCEYAYVIDLDTNKLEVYRGFNRTPLDENERFASFQEKDSKYTPVKFWHAFDLNALPSDDEFLATLTEDTAEAATHSGE